MKHLSVGHSLVLVLTSSRISKQYSVFVNLDTMAITTETLRTVEWNGKKVPVYPMQSFDFSKLLSQEPDELERLVRCCQNEGYFYIDLQGIDGRRFLEDQQETLKLMHRFFESPLEAKNQYGLVAPHLG